MKVELMVGAVLLKPDQSSKTGRLNRFGGKNSPISVTKPLLAGSIQEPAGSVRNQPFSLNWQVRYDVSWTHKIQIVF
jgi:hypothetical protein